MAFLNHQRPLWALLAAAPLAASISTHVQAQTWKINLRDADLTAFINEVADITGKNFAVDPRVRGNVTVISNKPLNKDEVYDLFLGVSLCISKAVRKLAIVVLYFELAKA